MFCHTTPVSFPSFWLQPWHRHACCSPVQGPWCRGCPGWPSISPPASWDEDSHPASFPGQPQNPESRLEALRGPEADSCDAWPSAHKNRNLSQLLWSYLICGWLFSSSHWGLTQYNVELYQVSQGSLCRQDSTRDLESHTSKLCGFCKVFCPKVISLCWLWLAKRVSGLHVMDTTRSLLHPEEAEAVSEVALERLVSPDFFFF